MEFPRGASNSATQWWANYHYTNSSGAHASYGWQSSGPDFTAGFYDFAVEWTASAMNFYLDGVVKHTITDTAAIADSANMYLILNQAVGGWPGDPPSDTPFPSDYLIDSVKVWQLPPSGSSTTSTWNVNGGGSWDGTSSWSGGAVPKYGNHQHLTKFWCEASDGRNQTVNYWMSVDEKGVFTIQETEREP